ncbi:hypothetical protein [Methylocapsa sp. S129]|uniref:hypothetical protein n=1 Tax=Methylocapsa sp. S129 TaxID=1641869 RepID=UPI00131D951C|nr:hypothetical protein [Methylocapsa sp. S129]
MRRLTMVAICVAVIVGVPAYAQVEKGYPPSNELQDSAPQLGRAVPSVTIVALETLPLEIQLQVGATVAQSSKEDMQVLRRSIDAMPEASAALRARGLNSAEVVAALVDDDGGLTLITHEEV